MRSSSSKRLHGKQVVAWVGQPKRDETRLTRLAILIEASAAGRRLDQLSPRSAPTR